MKKVIIRFYILVFLSLILGCSVGTDVTGTGLTDNIYSVNKGSGISSSLNQKEKIGSKEEKYNKEIVGSKEEKYNKEIIESKEEKYKSLVDQIYDELLKSVDEIKVSLNFIPEGFDGSQFDSIFRVLVDVPPIYLKDNMGGLEENKHKLYVSLKRDVSALSDLAKIVNALMSSGDQSVNWSIALLVLLRLNDSGECVSEVVNDEGEILSKDNLAAIKASKDLKGMLVLKDMLDTMLSDRNDLIQKIKKVLHGAAGLAVIDLASDANIQALVLYLQSVLLEGGFLYERIFSTDEVNLGLLGWNNLIKKQVYKLIH
ncbi:hypothetical protein baBA2_000925 (plasmid) [Borrelia anserina]|uniref:Lipoprotein n=1 Tax=Borrelia anserina Es TaxID=1365188 RepID=A0ABM6FVA6_BORAN|nr:hypothetical protein [Borrelia anserina]APR65331.1 hypothetical protein N187_A12 [Borrelia anserina Es]UPA07299.1 hypothetical protein baBA2_000925 [Borrelia anserina]